MAKIVAKPLKYSKIIMDDDIFRKRHRIYYCSFCKNLFVNSKVNHDNSELKLETYSYNEVTKEYQCLHCQEHIETPLKKTKRKSAAKSISYHINGKEHLKITSNEAEKFISSSINELFELGYSYNDIHLITRFSIHEIKRVTKPMFETIKEIVKLESYIPNNFLNKDIVLKGLPYSSKQFIIIHMLKQAIPYSIIAKILSVSERDVNSCMDRLENEYSDQTLIEQVLSYKEFSIFSNKVRKFMREDQGVRLFHARDITYKKLLEYRDKSNELVESFNKIIAEVDRLKSYSLSGEELKDLYLKRNLFQYTLDETDKNSTTLIRAIGKKIDKNQYALPPHS